MQQRSLLKTSLKPISICWKRLKSATIESLAKELDLFSVHDEIGAGLVLWHPNLAVVRENIENYWREEHRKRGYVIVNTPQIAKSKLWEVSGHIDHYRENMFLFKKKMKMMTNSS